MTLSSRTSFVPAFRTSKLAQISTSIVRGDLKVTFLALSFGTSFLATEGDKYPLGGKALWTKELEVALKENVIDMLVHDLNDVRQILSDGCEIGAMLERERVLFTVW
jgi:hydroxymethylbilane synthase